MPSVIAQTVKPKFAIGSIWAEVRLGRSPRRPKAAVLVDYRGPREPLLKTLFTIPPSVFCRVPSAGGSGPRSSQPQLLVSPMQPICCQTSTARKTRRPHIVRSKNAKLDDRGGEKLPRVLFLMRSMAIIARMTQHADRFWIVTRFAVKIGFGVQNGVDRQVDL